MLLSFCRAWSRCNFGLVLLHFVLVISSSAFFLSLWCVVLDFSFVRLDCHALPPPHSIFMVSASCVAGRDIEHLNACGAKKILRIHRLRARAAKARQAEARENCQRKGDPSNRGPEKCQFCGLIGHTHPDWRKFLASQSHPTSKPGPSTDRWARKETESGKKASQHLSDKLKSLSVSVNERKSKPELCCLTTGTVQSSSKRTTLGVDSGAEVVVWPPELFLKLPQLSLENHAEV